MKYGIFCVTPEGKKFIKAFDEYATAEKVVKKHNGVIDWIFEGVNRPLVIEEIPYSRGYMGTANIFYGFNRYYQKWMVLADTTMYRITGYQLDEVMDANSYMYDNIDYLSADIPQEVAIKILNKRYNIGA